MYNFELPSNVKQIGTICDELKIYIEDYVITYLKQYADSGGYGEKQAFLIGKYIIIDSQPYLFISGAVQGKNLELDDNVETFTEKSFTYAKEQMELFFRGYEIVGWMYSQPGYGVPLNQAYADFHATNFTKRQHVLFVVDPVEKVNCFYIWNTDMSGLYETRGYFIYYDKNPGMQDYMLENKIVRTKERPTSGKTEISREAFTRKKYREVDDESGKSVSDHNPEYKRVINMLVSLSAVLFVICLIMGAGLIQNDGRINKLEQNITALDSAYNYLATSLNRTSTQTVFAQDAEAENKTDDGVEEEISGDYEVADSPQDNSQNTSDIYDTSENTEGYQTSDEDVELYLETDESSNVENTVNTVNTEAVENTEGIAASEDQVATLPSEASSNANSNTQQSNADSSNTVDIPATYVVQRGDSLNLISARFYGSADMVDAIMELNGLDDPDKIFFGKILLLPQK